MAVNVADISASRQYEEHCASNSSKKIMELNTMERIVLNTLYLVMNEKMSVILLTLMMVVIVVKIVLNKGNSVKKCVDTVGAALIDEGTIVAVSTTEDLGKAHKERLNQIAEFQIEHEMRMLDDPLITIRQLQLREMVLILSLVSVQYSHESHGLHFTSILVLLYK